MSRDSTGPMARLRQLGLGRATPDVVSQLQARNPASPDDVPQLRELERRVAHLEQLVQGLQDSVYREGRRHDQRITALETRLEPGVLAAELSRDARERGLQ